MSAEWVREECGALHRAHALLLAKFGGLDGGPKAGCVESALGAALNAAAFVGDGDGDGDDILLLPACALVYLARNQCYTDGNKRLAWFAFVRLLGVYGLSLNASDEDSETLVLSIANAQSNDMQVHVQNVLDWTASRLCSLDELVPLGGTPSAAAEHSDSEDTATSLSAMD